MNKPITTLFMLSSVDGKISTGKSNELDFDKDIPNVVGCAEGLQQYYDIEQTTDLWSLNSGKVMAKIGVNECENPTKIPVSFVIIDNKNLTEKGVRYLCAKLEKLIIVTTNGTHPSYSTKADNLEIIFQPKLDLKEVLRILKEKYSCERLTIQSGGTLNGMFLREKLIDYVDIVVAPLLVGGKDTPTVVDGDSIQTTEQLDELGVLELESVEPLENSYVRLRYKVIS